MSDSHTCDVNVIVNHSIKSSLKSLKKYFSDVNKQPMYILNHVKNTFYHVIEEYFDAVLDAVTAALRKSLKELSERKSHSKPTNRIISVTYRASLKEAIKDITHVKTTNELFLFFLEKINEEWDFVDICKNNTLDKFESDMEDASENLAEKYYDSFVNKFPTVFEVKTPYSEVQTWKEKLFDYKKSSEDLFTDYDKEDIDLASEYFVYSTEKKKLILSSYDKNLVYSVNEVIAKENLKLPVAVDLNRI